MKNLYVVLGVPPAASADKIKIRYRELTRAKHPDIGGDPREFAEITEAGSVLTDDYRRREYNKILNLTCRPCPRCGGEGELHHQVSFTVFTTYPCEECHGHGYRNTD